jgi:anti-sigma factor ChrR (cupin superfamily)
MDAKLPTCPDPALLAACYDGCLDEPHQQDMRIHLSNCPACRGQLALLSRLESQGAGETPSELARARVLKLVRTPRFTARPAWAAVAILVLALGLAWQWPSPAPTTALDADAEQTRIAKPAPGRALALEPTVHGAPGGQGLNVEWQAVDSALYYDVSLVSRQGDLLSTHRVERNQLTLQLPAITANDEAFYIRVDAWLSASRKLRSEHVLIRSQDAR